MTDEPRLSFSVARRRDCRGGCLRGLVWAMVLEGVALLMLAFLIYEWRVLHL